MFQPPRVLISAATSRRVYWCTGYVPCEVWVPRPELLSLVSTEFVGLANFLNPTLYIMSSSVYTRRTRVPTPAWFSSAVSGSRPILACALPRPHPILGRVQMQRHRIYTIYSTRESKAALPKGESAQGPGSTACPPLRVSANQCCNTGASTLPVSIEASSPRQRLEMHRDC
jgi:hypothetical protein